MLYVHIADGFPIPSTNFFYPIFKSISIRVDATAIRRKRVDSVAAKIDNTGKLTYYQLDNDGKVMLDKITNSPIIYNINKE